MADIRRSPKKFLPHLPKAKKENLNGADWRWYLGGLSAVRTVTPVPDWDEYFIAIAHIVKLKSKDPRCPVGAVIVSPDNLVLSTGYNGLARGVADDEKLLENVPEKLKWICHAEENAILNAARAGASTRDCTIYVTKFPCFNCCNAIVQAGIMRIYTHDDKYWDDDFIDGRPDPHQWKVSQPHTRKPALLRHSKVRVDAPLHQDFSAGWRFRLDGDANGNDRPHSSTEPKRSMKTATTKTAATSNGNAPGSSQPGLFDEPSPEGTARKGPAKVQRRRIATRPGQRRRSGS
jgi:dCMP deaminase